MQTGAVHDSTLPTLPPRYAWRALIDDERVEVQITTPPKAPAGGGVSIDAPPVVVASHWELWDGQEDAPTVVAHIAHKMMRRFSAATEVRDALGIEVLLR